jgi:hypothetical protein
MDMYENVLVGVRDHESGLDAIALARELVSPGGVVTLLSVQVVARQPSASSGRVRQLAEQRRELKGSRICAPPPGSTRRLPRWPPGRPRTGCTRSRGTMGTT